MPETVLLDIQGQICPSCLLLALRTISQHADALRAGQLEVVILTDDRQATATIPETTLRMGYQCVVERAESSYRIRIHA